MNEYTVKMTLLSDTMFGSGESLPGAYDSDVLTDNDGIPYLKAKTFKGHLREKMNMIINLLTEIPEEEKELFLSNLLGSASQVNEKCSGILKFSDFRLSNNIKSVIKKGIKDNKFMPEDIRDAFTVNYTFTELDENGVAKEHSLRRCRMVTSGIKLYSNILSDRVLNELEEKILVYSVASIQHIGGYKAKGKGLIKLELFSGERDLEKQYIY